MEFNQKMFNILISIILIFVLKKILFTNMFEKLSSEDENKVVDIIRREYQVDIQAIRNLGTLSKRILDSSGKLILNHDVEIRGNLEMKGNIALHKNQIYFNTLTDHNHKIYYTTSGNKVVLQSFNKVELNTTQGNGTINIQKPLQVNGTGTFGVAIIGSRPSNGNQAYFGHKDKIGTKYFLMDNYGNIHTNGKTHLNGDVDIKGGKLRVLNSQGHERAYIDGNVVTDGKTLHINNNRTGREAIGLYSNGNISTQGNISIHSKINFRNNNVYIESKARNTGNHIYGRMLQTNANLRLFRANLELVAPKCRTNTSDNKSRRIYTHISGDNNSCHGFASPEWFNVNHEYVE